MEEQIQFMIQHMSQEGLRRAYAIIHGLWLRYGTSARTHAGSTQRLKEKEQEVE